MPERIVVMATRRAPGVDGLPAGSNIGDLDLARLGLFGHRDPQREHARVIASPMLGVQIVAQYQLAAERSRRPIGGVSWVSPDAPAPDGHHIALHVEVQIASGAIPADRTPTTKSIPLATPRVIGIAPG